MIHRVRSGIRLRRVARTRRRLRPRRTRDRLRRSTSSRRSSTSASLMFERRSKFFPLGRPDRRRIASMSRNFRLRFTYFNHGDSGRYVSARFNRPANASASISSRRPKIPWSRQYVLTINLARGNRLFDELVAASDSGGDLGCVGERGGDDCHVNETFGATRALARCEAVPITVVGPRDVAVTRCVAGGASSHADRRRRRERPVVRRTCCSRSGSRRRLCRCRRTGPSRAATGARSASAGPAARRPA